MDIEACDSPVIGGSTPECCVCFEQTNKHLECSHVVCKSRMTNCPLCRKQYVHLDTSPVIHHTNSRRRSTRELCNRSERINFGYFLLFVGVCSIAFSLFAILYRPSLGTAKRVICDEYIICIILYLGLGSLAVAKFCPDTGVTSEYIMKSSSLLFGSTICISGLYGILSDDKSTVLYGLLIYVGVTVMAMPWSYKYFCSRDRRT